MLLRATKLSCNTLCQCLSANSLITGTSIGNVISLYCFKRLRKHSFSKKHIALSATCKCEPEIHLTILRKSGLIIGSSLLLSLTSSTSCSSETKLISLRLFPNGHQRSRPLIRLVLKRGSFDRNNIEQRSNCSWNKFELGTLCSGTITLLKNSLCSSRRGTAKPEIILDKMSSNSDAPLNVLRS